MIVFPKAKINLGLRITSRRDDGFHEIQTVFYPAGISDALEFVVAANEAENDNLVVTGDVYTGSPDDNLVIKAARNLRVYCDFPLLNIHLHKAIPSGAGLGGGSADAAFLLKAVNKYFNLQITNENLKSIALELGSDCPFFIDATPAYATGRGEILEQIHIPGRDYYLVLVNPGVSINTKEAYQNCHPAAPSTSLVNIISRPVSEWKDTVLNDFEDYAFSKYPIISKLKNSLYNCGAVFSLMSGSGSAVYGIFDQKPELNEMLRSYLIWEGQL